MTSYRKSGTKVGRFTSNGFVEGIDNGRTYEKATNAGFYLFMAALAGSVIALINFFM